MSGEGDIEVDQFEESVPEGWGDDAAIQDVDVGRGSRAHAKSGADRKEKEEGAMGEGAEFGMEDESGWGLDLPDVQTTEDASEGESESRHA